MRFALRLVSASALAVAPFPYAHAQNAGKNLALDFRTTVVVQGTPDTGVITGHAVGTADKMRVDVKMQGSGRAVGMLSSEGTVSMIVTDSGKTITYLDSKNSQYLTSAAHRDDRSGAANGRDEDGFLRHRSEGRQPRRGSDDSRVTRLRTTVLPRE